ncbi:G-type lectin S-receptor-like serine/threonine-protein kinase SD2-5 [Cornus florida]|uniref:G-type lectin S-receptor-like serine/threonine-protein kinase SD2-5 n=1 Tax=Cornus florida TaxID=4283 RepID=UPI002899C8AA|nr:G-type lectin S-receptor-like serine/threonine-protein kinase SD2-5 [Cornus florida]
MACFMSFLIFLSYLFSHNTATSSSIYYLNSTLPSTWYNNDSINTTPNGADGSKVRPLLSTKQTVGFACGFYCINACTDYLFSVVVIRGGNHSVVWSANTEHPVKENAKLQLTGDGGLVLLDSDGPYRWSTNTLNKSVAGMNMTEWGNLVLFNDRGAIVWQSFDHPTDTLLLGQRLYEGKQLISHIYYVNFSSVDGFAAYTRDDKGQSQMYYQLAPEENSTVTQSSSRGSCRLLMREEEDNSSSTNDTSNYPQLQSGGFFVNWGASQDLSGSSPFELPALRPYIEYIKLDSHGHLKIYRHTNESGMSEVIDVVTRDLGVCQHPRQCGKYGLCREGKCSCPVNQTQFESRTQFQSPDDGCSRTTPLSCQRPLRQELVPVRNVSYFNIIDSNAAFPNITDIEGCKQACRQNCSCGAAFFRYDNNNVSDGYCYMPSEVLTMREGQIPNHNFSSDAYIKVQIPNKAPTNTLAIILGSISGALVMFCFLVAVIFRVKWTKTNTEDEEEDYIMQVPGMPVSFSYEELRIATEDFKEKLGAGGFGSVFKGTLRDGTEIAVKRLDKMGHGVKEFLAEVVTIGSIHHFNLVRLIGFCAEKSCRLLVYEYLSNGSLDNWIFYRDDKPCLDWQTRKRIIHGIAKGLAYLHEECRQRIIHLDIKPQNILLDENFNAKISDFGLSTLMDRDESQDLFASRGTPGYIAPECGKSRITIKVDVYSFGIVLIEVVSGRRNLDRSRSESSKHLLGLLQRKAAEDQLLDIVEHLDDEVQGHREDVVRLIKIGAWCLQDDHTKRPLMSTVVKVLEGVMEVDSDISYKFAHAMASSSVVNDHVSTAPQASVLSNPR